MSDWIKRRSYIRTAVRMIYAKSRSACVSWIRPNGFYACLCISMHICVCAYQPYSDSLITRWLFTQCVFSTLCINTIKDRKQNKLTPETQVPQPSPHILHYHTFSLHREAGLGHSDKLTSGKRVWNGNSVNSKFLFLFYNNKTLSVRAMQSSSCAGRSAMPPMMLVVATAATILPVTDLREFFLLQASTNDPQT